jgi:hypothetical protein
MQCPRYLFIALALGLACGVHAETKTPPPSKPAAAPPSPVVPEPPPPPENYHPPTSAPGSAAPSVEPEAEITITTKGTEIHEEHRINGKLYMIKVIPAKGKPYYLIDREGSGQFRRSDLETNLSIPMWVIKSF